MPDTWPQVPLGTLIEDIVAGVSVTALDRKVHEGEHGVLTLSAVLNERFNPSAHKAVPLSASSKLGRSVRANTILFSRSNTLDLVGSAVYVQTDHPMLHLPDLLWEISVPRDNTVCARWLTYLLQSPAMRLALKALASGTSGNMKKLSMRGLRQIEVLRPALEEQRAISGLLDMWDTAVDATERILKLKRKVKRALMQQLLSGRRRCPVFDGQPWREVRLREVAEAVRIRNRGVLGRDSVKAVTKIAGMIPMRPELIAGSIERYQIVPPNAFAYNPMRLNIGSIARWRGSDDVLVSPDYVVFRCKSDQLDPAYLDQFRRSHAWSSFMCACGNGSVRVRIWFDDLGVMKLKLPPVGEQRKIAAVLAAADREIDLLEQQLAALREQKKGLMQKLLTGRVRVSGDRLKVQER